MEGKREMEDWPDAGVRSRVAERFGLPWNPNMQDWEVEVADPERTFEFAKRIRSVSDPRERRCLLELTLASADEWLVARDGADSELAPAFVEDLCELIREPLGEFAGVATYWATADLPVSAVVKATLEQRYAD